MTEKPIIFSGPMVRAILDGGKTQTRRVIKPQPPAGQYVAGCSWNKSKFAFWKGSPGKSCGCTCRPVHMAPAYRGDRLWVREIWFSPPKPHNGLWGWQADGEHPHCRDYRVRPSIHMPRKYCRLFLDVKAVRVERLLNITCGDLRAEGMNNKYIHDNLTDYRKLWDSLNKKRGFGWKENPWVWVVEFEKVAA